MKIYLLITFISLTSCSKIDEVKNKFINESDLVSVIGKESSISLSIYKSSLTTLENGNVRAWIKVPKPDNNSEKPIERVADLLVEVSCNKKEMRLITATDINVIKIEQPTDDVWDIPSPASYFYNIVMKVCELSQPK